VATTSPTNSVYIFNLRQNFAVWCGSKLKVRGHGHSTALRRECSIRRGGCMNRELPKARSIDHYVLRGPTEWRGVDAAIHLHGFHNVEVSGYPGQARQGLHHRPGAAQRHAAGQQLRVQRSHGEPAVQKRRVDAARELPRLPTTVRNRDERFGWTGDAQIYAHTATLNADVAPAFYTKWLRELMESAAVSGTFPVTAPYPFQHGWDFGTAWPMRA